MRYYTDLSVKLYIANYLLILTYAKSTMADQEQVVTREFYLLTIAYVVLKFG